MRHSREELSRACAESLMGCWTLAYSSAPARFLWREPDMTLFSTGVQSNWQNGVLRARFTSKNMAARAEKALDYFMSRRLPMMWMIDPWTTPAELSRHLQDRGMIDEWDVPCMAIDLAKVRRTTPPSGLTIRPVNDLKSLEVCVATADKGFADGKKTHDGRWRDVYCGLGLSPTKRWFAGFLRGKPVASSLLVLHEGLATVWIVATLVEARGRGIGTAMVREALLCAKRLGYDFAIIQASKAGLPIYERMGFVEYCKVKTLIWNPK